MVHAVLYAFCYLKLNVVLELVVNVFISTFIHNLYSIFCFIIIRYQLKKVDAKRKNIWTSWKEKWKSLYQKIVITEKESRN